MEYPEDVELVHAEIVGVVKVEEFDQSLGWIVFDIRLLLSQSTFSSSIGFVEKLNGHIALMKS